MGHIHMCDFRLCTQAMSLWRGTLFYLKTRIIRHSDHFVSWQVLQCCEWGSTCFCLVCRHVTSNKRVVNWMFKWSHKKLL